MSGRRDPAMRRFIALLLAAAAALATGTAAAQQLLRNGGFEEGLGGWSTSSPTVELESAGGVQGSQAARLAAASARPAIAIQRLDLAALGGQVLVVSAQAKGAQGSMPNLWVRYIHPRTNKPVFIPAPPLRGDAGPWRPLRLLVYVPEGLASLSVGISNGLQSPLLIDEVSVLPHASLAPASSTQERRPAKVLEAAFAAIRTQALHVRNVNWTAIERAASDMVGDASMGFDEIQALQFALTSLGDGHSHRIPARDGSAAPAVPAPATEGVRHAAIGAASYVSIPTFGSMDSEASLQFATRLRDIVEADAGRAGHCGWILDLRGNGGGNMYPMLAGLWPLLGDGTLGFFVSPAEKTGWGMEEGRFGAIAPRLPPRPPLPNGSGVSSPVALLVGPRTASSGEIVALAFAGRPAVRSFGERTAGLVTANHPIPLPDGSTLALTVADITDRLGRTYPNGIDPDVRSRGMPAASIETDEAVRDAGAWLESACR